MSYDLMVFAPEAAPKHRQQFEEWYHAQTEWNEPHSYNDPQVCTPRLHAWLMEMIGTFPAMNGSLAPEELPEDEASLADYCIGKSVIYVGFAWSKTGPAYDLTFRLAKKHELGFFDVSSVEGEVWLPDGQGGFDVAHRLHPAAETRHGP